MYWVLGELFPDEKNGLNIYLVKNGFMNHDKCNNNNCDSYIKNQPINIIYIKITWLAPLSQHMASHPHCGKDGHFPSLIFLFLLFYIIAENQKYYYNNKTNMSDSITHWFHITLLICAAYVSKASSWRVSSDYFNNYRHISANFHTPLMSYPT